MEVPVVKPWPQLCGILQASPELANFVLESVGDTAQQLHVAIYCGEIMPGNALRRGHSNERKLLAFYWCLTNFRSHISREETWFHVCAIRSNRVTLVKDGYAQVFKQLMGLFFQSPRGLPV